MNSKIFLETFWASQETLVHTQIAIFSRQLTDY